MAMSLSGERFRIIQAIVVVVAVGGCCWDLFVFVGDMTPAICARLKIQNSFVVNAIA